MSLNQDELNSYLLAFCDAEPELLQRIDRETQVEVLMPRMLSGHLQGRLLSMLSKIMAPSRILEIGTFTGYATLCFAEGLAKRGKIITLDINEELEERVRGYFEVSNYNEKIDYRIGNAMEIIPTIDEILDIVFIDADKKNNGNYYNLVFEKVRSGGLIITDNVLWSGKVLTKINDTNTSNIHTFNQMVAADSRVEKLILPLRDGLFIVRKK